MTDHPQIKAFTDAAATMKAERYWSYNTVEERKDFLYALGDVLREVCYHLDTLQVLPAAAMQAYRDAAEIKLPAAIPTSAELILTTALQSYIDGLSVTNE